MSQQYLLDTNIVSELVRRPQGRVTEKIKSLGAEGIATSIIVASELWFGLAKAPSPRLANQLQAILGALPVLAFDAPAEHHYAELRALLEKKGRPIGANDLLIAAHALATDRVMVTDNTKEFRRVPGLIVENWLRES